MSLFDPDPLASLKDDSQRPLAERMRPETLDEFVGQQHILGPGKPLRMQIERDQLARSFSGARPAWEKPRWRASSRA